MDHLLWQSPMTSRTVFLPVYLLSLSSISNSPLRERHSLCARSPRWRRTQGISMRSLQNESSPKDKNSKSKGGSDFKGVGETGPAYLIAAFAQALPFGFPHGGRFMEMTYFVSTACAALFIGCKRAPLEHLEVAPLTRQQAIIAPVASSVFLFGAYLLIKYANVDVSLFFNFATTLLGLSCVADSIRPVYYSVLPKSLPAIKLPDKARASGSEASKITADMILSWITAVGVTGAYIFNMEPNFLFSNIIAFGIGARILSIVRPDSFLVAVGLLVGLLLYDVFWVFGADVMVTVATHVNSPGKFLVPRDLSQIVNSSGLKSYPFSILGLGDVCIPGVFATLALFLDAVLVQNRKEAAVNGPVKSGPYFTSAIVAYTLGLLICFGVNATTQAAQPALLYLVPAMLSSSLLTAASRNEVSKVLFFKQPKVDKKS